MGRLNNTYARLPLWAQQTAVSTYGLYWRWLRFGPGFAAHRKDYVAREAFSAGQWAAWQQEQLAPMLRDAATQVPYYERTWNSRAKEAALAGRLEGLPRLGKQAVRADPKAFLRQDLKTRFSLTFQTSGSTGTPVTTIWTIDELRNSMALREVRSAGWAGVSFTMPRATFSGRMIEPDPYSRGPFHRFNPAERQVYLSAFHLRSDTARSYTDALRRHGVRWLTGYAFSFYRLAVLVLELKLDLPPLEALITTSEKLTPSMRRTMQEAYRCPVFEEYGTVENSVFASECESGRLHLSPDAGIVEILRSDGTPCATGETGEIVATSLIRRYQPLIRYRIGDLGRLSTESCSCGRAMPVLEELVGRVEDALAGPDGRQMVRLHGLFVQLPHVREAQIVQESLTKIRVRVVPASGFGQADIDDIIRRAHQRMTHQVEVIVDPVSEIQRNAAGKFRAVVSMLGPRESE